MSRELKRIGKFYLEYELMREPHITELLNSMEIVRVEREDYHTQSITAEFHEFGPVEPGYVPHYKFYFDKLPDGSVVRTHAVLCSGERISKYHPTYSYGDPVTVSDAELRERNRVNTYTRSPYDELVTITDEIYRGRHYYSDRQTLTARWVPCSTTDTNTSGTASITYETTTSDVAED